jgi:hypothetical protein
MPILQKMLAKMAFFCDRIPNSRSRICQTAEHQFAKQPKTLELLRISPYQERIISPPLLRPFPHRLIWCG